MKNLRKKFVRIKKFKKIQIPDQLGGRKEKFNMAETETNKKSFFLKYRIYFHNFSVKLKIDTKIHLGLLKQNLNHG